MSTEPTFSEQWVARFVARWREHGADADYGKTCAEAWLDSNPDDVNENPEAVADDVFEEEMEQARQSI